MAVLFTVPRAVRGPLTVGIPSKAVPVGIIAVGVTINRFAWPAGTNVAAAELEISLDGGATWPQKVSVSMNGGKINYKGNPDAPSGFQFGIPEPNNTQRLVRGSVTLTVALDCSVVVEGV